MILNLSRGNKTYRIPVDGKEYLFINKKIGDTIDISPILSGYKIKLTGGSDSSGVPMRPDVEGPGKRYLLVSGGVGYRPVRKGEKARKLFRGNTYSADIVQVNAVVVEAGSIEPTHTPSNRDTKK
ncbi:MAG: 30S ribosomal protein S6e [Candidatus Micrarchaeota archaeon]|nr:30S ribosomal protein S6e [Candidatus Micrarchaeota archaeon]MCX8154535.1 30S ribosomal protein S6e [Candidatus Micrarchaeota archaeon]